MLWTSACADDTTAEGDAKASARLELAERFVTAFYSWDEETLRQTQLDGGRLIDDAVFGLLREAWA